jgi:hypothetical protein
VRLDQFVRRSSVGGLFSSAASGHRFVAKLAGRLIEFAAEDSNAAGSVEGQGDPISGHAPDFHRDVLANMNPFADFPAEYEHIEITPYPCIFGVR